MTESEEPTPASPADSGVYATDALSPEERLAFERALSADPDLSDEVRGLQATTAKLGEALAETPPPELRAKVMAEVERTRQVLPDGRTGVAGTEMGDSGGSVTDLGARRRSRMAITILSAAAVILGVLTLVLGTSVIGLRDDNAALTQAGADVTHVLTAPDARTISGEVEGQPSRGAVVVSPSLGSAVFVADDLATAPANQTYQLWLISADGSATSAGTFEPGPTGGAAVALTGATTTVAAVGMTLEPAGGSDQPTTPPILAIPLT
jgi:anti-sigma-K factor RskA